jgi:hypothetical protein
MKPRDHAMYYISDEINLQTHDETVKQKNKPFALFDRPILASVKDKIKHSRVSSANLWGMNFDGNPINYAALE